MKIFKYYINENNLKLLTITLPEEFFKANINLVGSLELFTEIRSVSYLSVQDVTNKYKQKCRKLLFSLDSASKYKTLIIERIITLQLKLISFQPHFVIRFDVFQYMHLQIFK